MTGSQNIMTNKLKLSLLSLLPVLVFTPLLIASRLIVGGSIPSCVDWIMLLGSASLFALNPILRRIESNWTRAIVLIMGFGLWSVLLFFMTFWIMRIVFSEAL